jgi:hypothetical protein
MKQSPSTPQISRVERIRKGCGKDYGDRKWKAEEILTIIKKYKLTEKEWKKRLTAE